MIASTYTYTFIDERNLFWHSLVFSAADRESAYVIDGLMRNDVVKSDIHSTDTHGFSEAIFAVTHLLGISFAPRIKNLKKQTLYMFRSRRGGDRAGWAIKPEQYVDPDAIVADWDDILRLVATIKLKEGTASEIFRRLNSYSRQHSPYTALKAFGRIIKSIFILRYIDDVELRMVIENLLNGSSSAIGLRARSRSATRVSSLTVIRRSRRSPKPEIDSSRRPSFAGNYMLLEHRLNQAPTEASRAEIRAAAAARQRPALEQLLQELRADDILVVTRLDRLARSTAELLRIAEAISEKNGGLQSLEEPWADTTTPAGRMVLTVFAGVAEFERALIRHRTDEGRQAAKRRGVSFGRPQKLRPDQKTLALSLVQEGRSISEVARTFNVHPATIHRCLNAPQAPKQAL
jgi:DNA invertase Pin-like site-specific DNA recombinase